MHRAISRVGVGRTSWGCTPFENERFGHTSRLGNPSASFLPSFFCWGPGSIGVVAPSLLPGAVSHRQSSEPGGTPTCPPSSRASPFWCWPGQEPLSFLGAAMLVALGQWLSVEVILPPGDVLPCPVMLGAHSWGWGPLESTGERPGELLAACGIGPPPMSAGGGRGLLWAPRRLGVLDRASVRGAVAWLVTQPGGWHSQAQARQGSGKTGTGCPSVRRDGGRGHLHRRSQDGSGAHWGSPPGPGPRWAGYPLRHQLPMTPFIDPVPALLHNGFTRVQQKPRPRPRVQQRPRPLPPCAAKAPSPAPLCSKGPAPAPVCCCVHVRAS